MSELKQKQIFSEKSTRERAAIGFTRVNGAKDIQ